MKRSAWTLAAVAGVLGSAAAASPATASTYTLDISAPAGAVVGQPMVIQASGIEPSPDQYWATGWIDLETIPASVMTSCPLAEEDGLNVAQNTGGEIITIAQRPYQDAVGNFTNLIGYTPRWPGARLLCGYLEDGAGATLARTQGFMDVTAAAAATPTPAPAPTATPAPPAGGSSAVAAKPANVKPPRVRRSGRTLRCATGEWTGASTYAFAWKLGNWGVKGASAARLRVTARMRGRTVRCAVTAGNAAGNATVLSRPLRLR